MLFNFEINNDADEMCYSLNSVDFYNVFNGVFSVYPVKKEMKTLEIFLNEVIQPLWDGIRDVNSNEL